MKYKSFSVKMDTHEIIEAERIDGESTDDLIRRLIGIKKRVEEEPERPKTALEDIESELEKADREFARSNGKEDTD